MSTVKGKWDFNWDLFRAQPDIWKDADGSTVSPTNINEFIHTKVINLPSIPEYEKEDFCAHFDMEGKPSSEPFISLIPFGDNNCTEINNIIQDGDIFLFLYPKITGTGIIDCKDLSNKIQSKSLLEGNAINVIRRRSSHAEICYKKDGIAYQASAWNDDDSPVCNRDHACNEIGEKKSQKYDISHILRIAIPEHIIERERLKELKVQVRAWKDIAKGICFPDNNTELCGFKYRFLDTIDYHNAGDIEEYAISLIKRDYASIEKMTCIQWAYLVLMLSLLVPLNEQKLGPLNVYNEFLNNWPQHKTIAKPDLLGIDKSYANEHLFISYTPAEILYTFIEMYLPELEIDTINPDAFLNLFQTMRNIDSVKNEFTSYIARVIKTKDIKTPFIVDNKERRFILPISIFDKHIKTNQNEPADPTFLYVGTAIYKDYVIERKD